ncbi:MAG: hypothetical protein ACFCU6_09410, partial [Balneolaceae bacterium]
VVQSVNGKSSREIFKVPIDNEIESVSWTKEQQYVLFTIRHDLTTHLPEDNQVWRISVEGGDPELLDWALEPWQLRGGGLRFHPHSNKIAYNVAGQNGNEIWVMENFLPSVVTAESSTAESQ